MRGVVHRSIQECPRCDQIFAWSPALGCCPYCDLSQRLRVESVDNKREEPEPCPPSCCTGDA